ncbi:enoyl-CoA hydratase/isomerase family protein [Streptomyces sp. JNUCC 63]
MSDLVKYGVVDGVARIVFNRPQVSNAIDLDTATALGVAVDTAAADDAVRAVLLTGAGKRFCAGGDVASFVAADDQAAYLLELAGVLDEVLQRLTAIPKPVVVGVQGAVAGAGLAVMLSGDLVVAGSSTKFVTAYAGIGLTPDAGLSWLLPRAVGQQRAAEMLLAGRALTAPEAVEWGLVMRTVDDEAVGTEALALAERLAAGPAHALGQARRLLRESWAGPRPETGADEARTIAAAVTTPEAQGAIARFLDR